MNDNPPTPADGLKACPFCHKQAESRIVERGPMEVRCSDIECAAGFHWVGVDEWERRLCPHGMVYHMCLRCRPQSPPVAQEREPKAAIQVYGPQTNSRSTGAVIHMPPRPLDGGLKEGQEVAFIIVRFLDATYEPEDRLQVWHFAADQQAEALKFYDDKQAQWSECYFCEVKVSDWHKRNKVTYPAELSRQAPAADDPVEFDALREKARQYCRRDISAAGWEESHYNFVISAIAGFAQDETMSLRAALDKAEGEIGRLQVERDGMDVAIEVLSNELSEARHILTMFRDADSPLAVHDCETMAIEWLAVHPVEGG